MTGSSSSCFKRATSDSKAAKSGDDVIVLGERLA
jgi:hypothetical protein